MLTTDQRDELLSVLSSIDSHYTSLIGTAVKGNEPQAAIDLPPTKVSSTPHVAAGMDETIGVAGDPTDNQQTVDLPQVADATFDFSVNDATNKKSGPTGSSRVYGKAAAKPSAPQIPGYRIQRVLGRGGMGIVYLAHQAGIDRPVALKMVLAGAHASKTTFERFLAEARAVGRFQHENIVRIYDIGWHDDLPYFSLEYIDGPSLSEKIGGQPLDPVEAAKLLTPLARALGYAHRAGVVHRDLKPGNVLLTTDGVPKLSDFGLAKQLEEGNEFSHTGDIVGTPGYMAPEQARGESTVGAPADIYGLGGVLYCMLTGRPPFLAAKISDTLLQLLEEEPVPPTRLQPGVPLDLQTICLKCLQKEPAQRYLTAEELAEDLERFSRGEPIMARPISRVERAWRWSRRKPRQAALIGAASFMGAMLMIGGPIVAGVIYQQKQEVIKAKNDIEIKEKEATVARGEAEKNAKVAQTNEKLANDNAALAKKNADEAKQNAEAAQTQEKNAVDALKSLVFEVQRRMQDQPRLQAVRTALLKVASDGVKRMEESGGNVAAQNIITASIERRMGDLNMELGRIQSAHDNYQKCLTILVKLQQEKQLPGARHNLSTAYELLGVSSRRLAKLTDARRYLEQCLEERRQWVKEEPNDENVRQNVAATLGMLGTLAQEQGDLVAAKNFLEEGAKLREEYRAARPNDLNRQLQVIGLSGLWPTSRSKKEILPRHEFDLPKLWNNKRSL